MLFIDVLVVVLLSLDDEIEVADENESCVLLVLLTAQSSMLLLL